MRLWHKELIPVLPKKQLISQWRECCGIARNIATEGTPNHILVNRIMDYPIDHFIAYSKMVMYEMVLRGYSCESYNFLKWFTNIDYSMVLMDDIFCDWHNDRYYWQCYYNLEEKFDCGGIEPEEWEAICDEVCMRL